VRAISLSHDLKLSLTLSIGRYHKTLCCFMSCTNANYLEGSATRHHFRVAAYIQSIPPICRSNYEMNLVHKAIDQ
jgi:hypothetical protein